MGKNAELLNIKAGSLVPYKRRQHNSDTHLPITRHNTAHSMQSWHKSKTCLRHEQTKMSLGNSYPLFIDQRQYKIRAVMTTILSHTSNRLLLFISHHQTKNARFKNYKEWNKYAVTNKSHWY